MALDFTADKSIFLQIAEMIENDIVRGVLGEDEQTLSTHELARALSVNPNTAAKGLAALMNDGILYKKRGVGMFVAPGARELIIKKRRAAFFTEYARPFLHEARVLGISLDELIKMISEERI